MVPASASISTRTPMGMARLWDTWPIIAPEKAGLPSGTRCGSNTSFSENRPYPVGDTSRSVNVPRTTPAAPTKDRSPTHRRRTQ